MVSESHDRAWFIETIRELWWDLRPHQDFRTVEDRFCHVPGSLEDAVALAAPIHCLANRLSDDIDEGTYQHDCHPMMVRQNKRRAARCGLDAQLLDSQTYELIFSSRWRLAASRRTNFDINSSGLYTSVKSLADHDDWAELETAATGHS